MSAVGLLLSGEAEERTLMPMNLPNLAPSAPSPFCVTRLAALPFGWQAVKHAILSDGALAAIATDVDLAGEQQRISAAIRASTAPNPPSRLLALSEVGTARIWIATPSGWTETLTCPLEAPWLFFDRFADGRWLIVSAGTSREDCARVLSPAGLVVDRFTLGDGISHVAIDAADRIWVGWSDEGMFRNNGWRVPCQEWPPSTNGVACFTSDGTLLPLPEWPAGAGTIADCYALNVVEGAAWACPYTEFPLVRFVPGEPARWWRSALIGQDAIALDGSHALIGGGYREEANRLALVALEGDGHGEDARPLASWALPLRRLPPSTQEWMPVWDLPTLLVGRDDTLHLIDGGLWYRWRVADCAAELK
jgi:hypothetical protein